MNVILERTSQVRFFTDMRATLAALGIRARDFDWYVSDIETNWQPEGFTLEDQWMDGDVLDALLAAHELQFTWAVFSAVPKCTRMPIEQPPYVDGNPGYWNGQATAPQLPGALFEIACWDSSGTILVGLPDENIAQFRQVYSDAKPLGSPR
jgi:hypothetical protein